LLALRRYPFKPDILKKLQEANAAFSEAFPGLKGVRDSAEHVEERVRGEAFGKKIATQPISNSMVDAPDGGVMIIGSLNGDCYGGTIADGTYAEVEVTDRSTEVARAAVQAAYDALPWRAGHRLFEPSA
jgi:hypothetical protein